MPAPEAHPEPIALLAVAAAVHPHSATVVGRLRWAGGYTAQGASSLARMASLLWAGKQASGGVGCVARTEGRASEMLGVMRRHCVWS